VIAAVARHHHRRRARGPSSPWASILPLFAAAVTSGGVPTAIGTTLNTLWTKAQTDLKAGEAAAARADLVAFAALVVAGRVASKITPARPRSSSGAQTIFTSIGGQGSL
jgi:hypothetical protein